MTEDVATRLEITRAALLAEAERCEPAYGDIMAACAPFERAAVMHSELLMVFALYRLLGLSRIAESGRHLGHSTEVLSHFGASQFVSVELRQDTPEALVAGRKLRSRPVALYYGDAADLLPPLVNADTLVLIDGPKGRDQLRLAVRCLERGAPVVAMHDTAPWTPTGKLLVRTGLGFLSSDDPVWVERFRHLDDRCWERKRKWYSTEPYVYRGRKVASYGATVSAVFGGDLDHARRVLDMEAEG